jgi:hypothetical protein
MQRDGSSAGADKLFTSKTPISTKVKRPPQKQSNPDNEASLAAEMAY